MHFMAVKTERSGIRQITQYLIILDMGAVLQRILFMEKNAISDFNRLTDSSTILVNQFNNLTRDFKTKCSLTDANQALMTEPS